jgi:hypothetical protein
VGDCRSTSNSLERFLSLRLVLRELEMKTACVPRGRILLLVLFIASHLSMTGCNDQSRTTGTVVEVSEEFQAHTESKLDKYKGGPPKAKVKAPSKKK